MAKHCTNCGKELTDGTLFCTECGTKAEQSDAPAPQNQPAQRPTPPPQQTYQQQTYAPPVYAPAPHQAYLAAEPIPSDTSKYQPISTGGYIGIFLLMGIPLIGLIITIIWADSAADPKENT